MAILEAPALQRVTLEPVYSFLPPQAGADPSGLEGPAKRESTKSEVKVGTIVFHDDEGKGMGALREVLKVASQLYEFEIHSKYIYTMFSTIQNDIPSSRFSFLTAAPQMTIDFVEPQLSSETP